MITQHNVDSLKNVLKSKVEEQNRLRDEANEAFARFQSLTKKRVSRPRVARRALEGELRDLENEQETRGNMSRNAEREILRDIHKVKEQLKENDAYDNYESEKDTCLDTRDSNRERADAMHEEIIEAKYAVDSAVIALKLKCDSSDIAQKIVEVPREHVGILIGRERSTQKKLEDEFNVVLEFTDRWVPRTNVSKPSRKKLREQREAESAAGEKLVVLAHIAQESAEKKAREVAALRAKLEKDGIDASEVKSMVTKAKKKVQKAKKKAKDAAEKVKTFEAEKKAKKAEREANATREAFEREEKRNQKKEVDNTPKFTDVAIFGPAENVERMVSKISVMIPAAEATISLKEDLTQAIIRTKGFMRNFEEKQMVRFNLNSETNSVRISGSVSAVKNAEKKLYNLTTVTNVPLKGSVLKVSTWKNSPILALLRSAEDVVTSIDKSMEEIHVWGMKPSATKSVVQSLKTLIASYSEQKMTLENDLKFMIIDNKMAKLNELRETGANLEIDFSREENAKPSASVATLTIGGFPEALGQTLAKIEELKQLCKKCNITFKVSQEELRYLGDHMKTQIEEIGKEHEARIIPLFRESQVAIRSNDVEKTQEAKKAFLALMDNIIVTELVAPPDAFELIIGDKGVKARELEAELHIRVQCIRDPESDTRVIKIVSSEEEKTAAVEKIASILGDFVPMVDSNKYFELIRDEKKILNELSEAAGCKIDMTEYGRCLRFHGDEDKIEIAKTMINEWSEKFDKEVFTFEIDNDEIGRFMGKGGSTRARMEEELGVTIRLPKNSSLVVVRGPEEKLAEAKKVIFADLGIVENVETITVSIFVPQGKMGRVIGPKGSTLESLRSDNNVRILTPRRDNSKKSTNSEMLTVKGEFMNVEAAIASIEKHISEPVRRSQVFKLTESRCQSLTTAKVTEAELETGAKVKVNRVKFEAIITGTKVQFLDATMMLSKVLTGKSAFHLDLSAGQSDCLQKNLAAIKFGLDAEVIVTENAVDVDGTRAAVHQKIDSIMQQLKVFFAGQVEEFNVPAAFVGIFSQVVISELMKKFQNNIVLVGEKIMVFGGEPMAVIDECKNMIELQKKRTALVDFDKKLGFLISGKYANDKQRETGVKISISNGTLRLFSEDLEKLEACKQAIVDDIMEFESRIGLMKLPLVAIPAIVGKGGSNIKKLQQDCSANLRLRDQMLQIEAKSADGLEHAQGIIAEFLESEGYPADGVEANIQAPQALMGLIVGPRGSNIEQLREESNCHIRADNNVINLFGSEDAVNMARQKILAIIEQNKEREQQREREQEEKPESKPRQRRERPNNKDPVVKDEPKPMIQQKPTHLGAEYGVPLGATAAMIKQAGSGQQLSKAAKKNLKRKMKKMAEQAATQQRSATTKQNAEDLLMREEETQKQKKASKPVVAVDSLLGLSVGAQDESVVSSSGFVVRQF